MPRSCSARRPSKGACKDCAGSALLDHPARIEEIVRACVSAAAGRVPVTAKMRSGIRDDARLESSARQIAVTIAAPLLELAQARGQAGDSAGTLNYLRRAARLSPSPQLAALIAEIEARGLQSVFGAPGNPPRR